MSGTQTKINRRILLPAKVHFKPELPMGLPVPEIEKAVSSAPESAKWLKEKPLRKIIVVPGKIMNVVV